MTPPIGLKTPSFTPTSGLGLGGSTSNPLQQVLGAGQQIASALQQGGKLDPNQLMGPLGQLFEGLQGLQKEKKQAEGDTSTRDVAKMLQPILEMLQKMLGAPDEKGGPEASGGGKKEGAKGEPGIKEMLGHIMEMLEQLLGKTDGAKEDPFARDEYGDKGQTGPFGGSNHCSACFHGALKGGGASMGQGPA